MANPYHGDNAPSREAASKPKTIYTQPSSDKVPDFKQAEHPHKHTVKTKIQDP